MILVEFAIDWAEEEVTPHYSESDMLISWHIFPSKKQDSYLGRWDEEAQIRMMRRADSWLVFQTRAADNGCVSLLNDKPACSAPKSLSCESQMNGSQWMLRGVTMGELVTVCIPILKSSSNHATVKVKVQSKIKYYSEIARQGPCEQIMIERAISSQTWYLSNLLQKQIF